MSLIKEESAKTNNLKIRILETSIIHTFKNLNSHFWRYLAILSNNTTENEKILRHIEWTKSLEEEEMRLSN